MTRKTEWAAYTVRSSLEAKPGAVITCSGDIWQWQYAPQIVIRLSSPFLLPGFDGPQPPATIASTKDEELIDVPFSPAWRRVSAIVHLPAIGMSNSRQQIVPVAPADLEAALKKDRKQS